MRFLLDLLLAALALSSCGVRSSNVSLDLPLTKQKQKIIFLQKKLELAEREEKKIHAEIERLGDEMRQTQLALIRKQVDEYEEQIRKQPKKKFDLDIGELFLNERDQLHRMIQSGASIYEAQIVLDRILQLITELSDELY